MKKQIPISHSNVNRPTSDEPFLDRWPTNPESRPEPGGFPGEFPDEFPMEPPPYIQCGPVSGLYEGVRPVPPPPRHANGLPPLSIIQQYEVAIRIDVDSPYPNAFYSVVNKVSGDFFTVYNAHARPFANPRVYTGSWIVDNPSIAMNWPQGPRMPCRVLISGDLRFYSGTHPVTRVAIVINPGLTLASFTEAGSSDTKDYTCHKVSSAFRHVNLELDVCRSVNAAPILPSYDTNDHPVRPVGLTRRLLTVDQAYLEAGIAMSINPTRSIIDDTALPDTNWLPAELHDAMETHFSRYPASRFFASQQWNVWGMLSSGVYQDPRSGLTDPRVAGIMFDYSAAFGNAPDRQGCVVFREHPAFNYLPTSGVPANQNEAWALRQFLYTYVHEVGHAFNLLHSWQKRLARPPALGDVNDLSWMNYPDRYNRNNVQTFWSQFPFQFEDPELIHLRHGDRAAVIFGGDPFTQNAALRDFPPQVVSNGPIQLSVAGKQYFHFLEPVVLEVTIKNVSKDHGFALTLETEATLSPESGSVILYIQRPDGRVLAYEPPMHILSAPTLKKLAPDGQHTRDIAVSYGKHGHYFDEPGRYRVRALYTGLQGMVMAADVIELYVGRPFSRDEEREAQDFYSKTTGMALYLGGSDSPFLDSGMDCLRRVAERFEQSPVGAHLSLVLAQHLSRSFRIIAEAGRETVEVEGRQKEVITSRRVERKADPKGALNLVERALAQYDRDATTFQNMTYAQCCRTKAQVLVDLGRIDNARSEIDRLIEHLRGRDVTEDVLVEIEAFRTKLEK